MKCNSGHIFNISRKFFMSRYKSIKGIPCLKCNNNYSNPEQFIIDILNKNNISYRLNDRKIISPYEIDIVIDSHKLCIEINGNYYHSEIFKEADYHLNKTNLIDNYEYSLLHIWGDYIIDKPDIVESMLLNRLGLSKRIYARKCEIRQVSSRDCGQFLINNHLQGKVNSSIKLGLYYGNELISLMTFGSLRRSLGQKSKANHFELLRFCNKLGISVIGGASKLFKYFLKQYKPREILSYAKRDWSTGNLYYKLGFNFDGYTKPGYYWVKNNERYYRFNYRKSKLIEMGFDKTKSAVQIMHERGFYRIYDSGNLRFKLIC